MYSWLFEKALFPAYETLVKRRYTDRYLRELLKSQWLEPEELQAIQLAKLNALIEHAWQNVPFLGGWWRSHGLTPRRLHSVAELATFPVLTKDIMRANYQGMVARNWAGKSISKTTGGSTGEPFRFEYTVESYARRNAAMWRGYSWSGSRPGVHTAYVWGASIQQSRAQSWKDRLYHRAFNRMVLNAFQIQEATVGEYIRKLNRFRPRIIVGYVAPLLVLARHINRTQTAVHAPQSVITGAEALYQPDREEIARAFGCPVFNTYGCREFMLMAAECEVQDGLHLTAENLVEETAAADGQPVSGEAGDVLVTDLHNYAMPFVRYRNGDRAIAGAKACSCGRGLPLLQSVEGRILDLILTPDGRHVLGEYCVYVMLDFTDVKNYQFVQVQPDEVHVLLVADAPLAPARIEAIRAKMLPVFGSAIKIVFKQVEQVMQLPSGKRRVSVSLVNRH